MSTLVFEQYRKGMPCSTVADIKKNLLKVTAMSVELLITNDVIDTVQEGCTERFVCVGLINMFPATKDCCPYAVEI